MWCVTARLCGLLVLPFDRRECALVCSWGLDVLTLCQQGNRNMLQAICVLMVTGAASHFFCWQGGVYMQSNVACFTQAFAATGVCTRW